MKLILNRHDLLDEHADRNCSRIKFEHFKPRAQAVIRAAGRAQFREYDGRNYNAVHAPADQPPAQAAPEGERAA